MSSRVARLRALLDGRSLADLSRCRAKAAWTGRRCRFGRIDGWTTCYRHRQAGEPDLGECETRLGQLCSEFLLAIASPTKEISP